MNKRVLTICSSYQRPELAKRMIESYIKATESTAAHLIVYVGEKDPFIEEYKKISVPKGRASYEIVYGPRLTMVQVLNKFSLDNIEKYDYFSEINDDHVVVTEGWETKQAEAIDRKNNGFSISYGQTLQFPTAVMYGKKLIEGLGFMFPPEYAHTYVDRWLMDLGFGANLTIYVPDVLVDHMHPTFNKGTWDNVYYDGGDEMHIAEKIYEKWCEKKHEDINRIKALARSHRVITPDQIPDLSKDPLVCMMTTHDRIDLLDRTVRSISASTTKPQIYVFDDFGPNSEKIIDASLRLQDSVVISDKKHRGLEGSNFWAMESLFDKGARAILILDSDCLVAKKWWETAIELCRIMNLEDNILCLFNARVHSSEPLRSIGGILKKKYVGGLGLIVTKTIWDRYLTKIQKDGWVGWDGNLCNQVQANGAHVLVCTPSMIQHTGWKKGSHADVDDTACVADDFDDVTEINSEIITKEQLDDRNKILSNQQDEFNPSHKSWNNPGMASKRNKWLIDNGKFYPREEIPKK